MYLIYWMYVYLLLLLFSNGLLPIYIYCRFCIVRLREKLVVAMMIYILRIIIIIYYIINFYWTYGGV